MRITANLVTVISAIALVACAAEGEVEVESGSEAISQGDYEFATCYGGPSVPKVEGACPAKSRQVDGDCKATVVLELVATQNPTKIKYIKSAKSSALSLSEKVGEFDYNFTVGHGTDENGNPTYVGTNHYTFRTPKLTISTKIHTHNPQTNTDQGSLWIHADNDSDLANTELSCEFKNVSELLDKAE